jgi:HPt (histidine-containing phosphotransfer) domain-containing protein
VMVLHNDRAAALPLMHEIFKRELGRQISALGAALQDEDRELARTLAHRLSDGSRQLGALALAERCAELEQQALSAALPALAPLHEQIRAAYQQALELIIDRYGGAEAS